MGQTNERQTDKQTDTDKLTDRQNGHKDRLMTQTSKQNGQTDRPIDRWILTKMDEHRGNIQQATAMLY